MAFVAAPNIVMTEFRMILAGQKIENRVMINNEGSPTLSELQGYATLAWDWWENTYAASICTSCLLAGVVTTDMGVQNGQQYTYAPDTTTTGEVATIAMPNETSFCVTLSSGLRGRSARGRWFVAAIPDASRADANNLNATAAEAYRSAIQTLIDAVEALARHIVIVSYVSNKVPRPGGPVYFEVTNATITDTILDSQRRRKPGVGA